MYLLRDQHASEITQARMQRAMPQICADRSILSPLFHPQGRSKSTKMANAESLKEQGNEEFKKGEFLKAAATYTKAIKEDPQNAVLYRCGTTLALGIYAYVRTLVLPPSCALYRACARLVMLGSAPGHHQMPHQYARLPCLRHCPPTVIPLSIDRPSRVGLAAAELRSTRARRCYCFSNPAGMR